MNIYKIKFSSSFNFPKQELSFQAETFKEAFNMLLEFTGYRTGVYVWDVWKNGELTDNYNAREF